jgi:hypothetical protein
MSRIMVVCFAVSPLLACQAREQPHAPAEAESTTAVDSPVQSDAYEGRPAAKDEKPDPIAGPVSPEQDFFPESCLALKEADPSLPSGTYRIYPGTSMMQDRGLDASCDMETDGGGWTLVLNYNHQGNTNPELNVRFDSLPQLGSDVLGRDESQEPEFWGHAGNEMLRVLTGFQELRFHCRSSENSRVLHFKTDDPSCVAAVQLGTGGCENLHQRFVPMSDHNAILPATADRWEIDRMDATLTYNTFGKTEANTPARMWSIRAEPSQQVWECDYGSNDALYHTLHRVWIR